MTAGRSTRKAMQEGLANIKEKLEGSSRGSLGQSQEESSVERQDGGEEPS